VENKIGRSPDESGFTKPFRSLLCRGFYVEKMEVEGVVGPSDGAKPRKVLAEKLPR